MDDSHLRELIRRAEVTGRTQFSRFLTPAEQREVRYMTGDVRFYGGYEDAEMAIAAFGTEIPEDWEWPIETLSLRWNTKFSSCEHRDLLGAATALGLARETFGDIALSENAGEAYLFCMNDMADYFKANLASAGRAALKVDRAVEVRIAPPKGMTFHATVQSRRLDAVAAAGYQLSRATAQKLMTAGLVKLDHVPELRTDAQVTEGSLISVRGYGRLKIEEVIGETRKGRIGLTLFQYGKH
ncbi:MAG: YlmH/Sll1252 family protein [Clostridia bacterium]|nr:YlmH/Sll1252 family protein [Clostridia bacterium]